MNLGKFALAAVLAGTPSIAQAVVVTRTFVASALFTDGGPVAQVNFTFGLTYDDAAGVFFNKAVDYYTTTSSYASFNITPVTFSRISATSFAIDGGSFGLTSGTADFELLLVENGPNTTPAIGFSARYNEANSNPTHVAGGVLTETTPVASVPEPASWTLMIGGFGIVGAGMRRRRYPVRVRFA